MTFSRYPYIISYNYYLFMNERDINKRFRQLIRIFSATLKFLSLTALAEYLSRPDSYHESVDEFLCHPTKFSKPSLGHFKYLLEHLMKASKSWLDNSSIQGLRRNIKHNGKILTEFIEPIDHLIHVRNIYVHSDIEEMIYLHSDTAPSTEDLEYLIGENLQLLEQILVNLNWLADGGLFLVKEDGDTFLCQQKVRPHTRMNFCSKPGVWWSYNYRAVYLPPFIIGYFANSQSENDVDRVLQYETLLGNRIKYIFGKQGFYVDDTTLNNSLHKIQKEAKSRSPKAKAITEPLGGGEMVSADWDRIVESSKKRSERIIDFQIEQGKYLAATYTNRVEIEKTIHNFVFSEKRLLIVLGESGSGKTNTLCWATQEMLAEQHAVLHYYGREYQGQPLIDILAQDLVWNRNRLDEYLKACSALEATKNGKRLIVIIDALNEYTYPEILFQEILSLVENRQIPAWVKIIITCRPMQWEYIESGFTPNYQIVYYNIPITLHDRKPYVILDYFTEDELNDAWDKWKKDNGIYQDIRLPNEIFHLVRQPILFRCLLNSIGKTLSSDDNLRLPNTSEEILMLRFQVLDETLQRKVEAVVDAMWRSKKDFLTSIEYTIDERIEEWISSDQGPDMVKIYGCRKHRTIRGVIQEYDERQVFRPIQCRACRNMLEPIEERKILPPRDILRDEGFLIIHQLHDGDDLLRFTYDRMYEVLTGRHVINIVRQSLNPEIYLLEIVRDNVGWDKAAINGAIQIAVLMGLSRGGLKTNKTNIKHDRLASGQDLLDSLYKKEASIYVQDFIRDVLLRWMERDFLDAWHFTKRMVRSSAEALRKRKKLISGLQPGIHVLSIMLFEGSANAILSKAELRSGQLLLIDIALDSHLTIYFDRDNISDEKRKAICSKSPNDICLEYLLDYCLNESQQGTKDNTLAIVREVFIRLKGVTGVFRHRKRLKALIEWIARLLASEVRNRGFVDAFLKECRTFISTLPFIDTGKGWTKRTMRSALLRVPSIPLLIIIDNRLRSQMLSIPSHLRKYPEESLPNLSKILHVTKKSGEKLQRILQLYKNPDLAIIDSDVELSAEITRMHMDEPLAGILIALLASIMAMRNMKHMDAALSLINKMMISVDENMEFEYFTNSLCWAILYNQKAFKESDNDHLLNLTFALIKKFRKCVLQRYEGTGQLKIIFSAIHFSDIYREDGEMVNCRRFLEKALEQEDWPVMARFWDQLLFACLLKPKTILRHLEQIVSFDGERLIITCGERSFAVSLESLLQESVNMSTKYRPDYDPDCDDNPRTVAVLHMLCTIGTLELIFQREVESFYRRKSIPDPFKYIIREVRNPSTLEKLRDERLAGYFGVHVVCEFPQIRDIFVNTWEMLYDDAKQRDFKRPSRGDMVRFLERILDMVLRAICNQDDIKI